MSVLSSSSAQKQASLLSAFTSSPLAPPLSSSPPSVSSDARPVYDPAVLKAKLTSIVDDMQRSGTKATDPSRSLAELVEFFEAVSDKSGSTVQDLFGQNVTANVLIIVMDSVVKRALEQYCSAVARQRQNRVSAPRTKSLRGRTGQAQLIVAPIAEAELDALSDAKTKRLRSDVVRPFRALVEVLHMNLPASLLSSATAGSTAPLQSNSSGDTANSRGELKDNAADFNAPPPPPSLHSSSALDSPQRWWASAPNYSALPLLWKNAVPLHTLTNHALMVMQSNVLLPACGAEYAQLLLRICAYDGYLAALQSSFIRELTGRLLRLIETTSYEPGINNEAMPVTLSLGDEHEGIGHDPLVGHEGTRLQTTVDDGTTYASLLVQLLRAPHLMSSFVPCEDTVITTAPMQGELTIPLLLQTLVRLITQRHARFTSALRLEAHLLVALNQLVSAARHDYPLACAAPLELVKLLCDFFDKTDRRDGWRMESLSFMTTQLCASFSAVLGQCVRVDIESMQRTPSEAHEELYGRSNAANNHNTSKKRTVECKNDGTECREQDEEQLNEVLAAQKKSFKREKRYTNATGDTGEKGNSFATTAVSVPPHCLTLLHETVLPFALRLFQVERSKFSHVSRRELFHFPCPTLAPLFDFGAVVLYLACRTHASYVSLPAAASVTTDAQVRKRHRTDDLEAHEKHLQSCGDTAGRAQDERQLHPSTKITRLFRSFFFLEGSPQHSGNSPNTRKLPENIKNSKKSKHDLDDTRTHIHISSDSSSISHESPGKCGNVSRGVAAAAAAGSTLSAAAVQDLVSDCALFLLHLLAQPAVALAVGPYSCAQLVEDGLIPLFPHYGVRLESLLLAALQALAPRAGLRCGRNVFSWLLHRYVPSPTTQRDDKGHPKEPVYRLLASLLDHTTSRVPMRLNAEEKERLSGAVHFANVATYVRAVQAASWVNQIPPATTMLAKASTTNTGGGGTGALAGRAGISSALFQSMLRFLAALHLSLCSGCIVDQGIALSMLPLSSIPASPSSSSSSSLFPVSSGPYLMSDRSAVQPCTGLSFIFSCLSHAIFFFPPDEGIKKPRDTATEVAARHFLLQTMSYVESYLVALSALIAANGDSGWPAQIHAHGRHSDKVAVSLRRMHRFILRARQSASASSMSPAAHVPSAVSDAAEGHWLLLPPFIPSVVDVQASQGIDASLTNAFSAQGGSDDVCASGDQLRRGDVPAIIVESIANAVSGVVIDLSHRARVLRTTNEDRRDTADGVDADMVLCVQTAQLLHTIVRLFRVGLWHLPLDSTKDLAALESAVPLFDNPSVVFPTLSAEGKLYYAVMWSAAHISMRIPRLLQLDRPLLRVLDALFDDVGHVLLSQPFALWEPRQTVIGLAAVICRRSLEGITRIATRGAGHSSPHTANSEVDLLHAQDTTRLSCRLMGTILAQARRSRVIHASVEPIADPSIVCKRVVEMLVADELLTPHGEAVVRGNSYLPVTLSVIDSLAGLLQVLHEECGDSTARKAVRGLLTTLFARHRHSMAEGIFLAFGFYAPQRCTSTSAVLRDMNPVSENGGARKDEEQDMREKNMTTGNRGIGDKYNDQIDIDDLAEQQEDEEEQVSHLNQAKPQTPARADVQHRQNLTTVYTDGCSLLLEEGRLLASFVDQLTDASRADMPMMTVQSQCAVLSSIYGLLFRCESTVAEKLGKYLFSFLSVTTAYAVRRHTALHVRYLFTRFTQRAFAVLHELLYRGREGIASLNPMLCATSLRALGEAARAAPMMEPDVISTLLEWWATHGFAHRGLLTECLELIGNTMSTKELCHYYCERLLFDWLWRLRHPMEAFPVVCFGYTCLADLSRELLPTLLPLAVLCSAKRSGADGTRVMHNTRVPTAGVDDNEGYFCPNDLLWRLVGSNGGEGRERSPAQLVQCLVMKFSDVVARLLAFAALSSRSRRATESFCENVDTQEVAEAAKISLEWMRSTFTAHQDRTGSDFTSLLRLHGDGILCRLVSLVGTAAAMPAVPQLRDCMTLYCSLAGTSMDEFFSSDAGDHAYVLLQHIYACAMNGVARGPRRALLILLFERIVRQWWGSRVLLVPHVAHTVLRVSGNLLMSCPEERPLVCDVLLYTWTILTSKGNATSLSSSSSSMSPFFRQLLAADEAFLSTVMLALSEESRAVASTWAAICRTDTSLQRRDWQLQHSQHTASGGDVIILDECTENDADDGGKEEGNQATRRLLPLLRNVVLVSGAPASAYYADLASAVDAARDAFAEAIRNRKGQSHQGETSSSICDALSRALRHLFAVVIANEDGGGSVAAAFEQSLTSYESFGGSAGASFVAAPVMSGPRDAFLSAFDLLRAISWCFIEAGAEQQVDALLSSTGAMERQMQEDSLDTVLHDAYRRHLEQLYRLAFDSDAKLASAAAATLRGWLCNAVYRAEEAQVGSSEESTARLRRGDGEEVNLMQQVLSSMEHNEKKKKLQDHNQHTEGQKKKKQEDISAPSYDDDGVMLPLLWLEDILPFRRRPLGLPAPYGIVNLDESDTIAASIASLQDENVWDALRVYADESRFLRFFLISLFRHYGLQHRVPTVGAVLSGLLLPTASGEYNRRRASFFESFLPIALLHVMLLRETENQRTQRAEWSRVLQETLFAHAARFPHTTRLFLRALNVCRAAVMSNVRGRGLRPDGSDPRALSRMVIKSEEPSPFTFPVFPRSAYGELPEVSDMRESYWLCDMDPLVLASAAVACHEPHLAILFADLSGESLLGRRKGIPTSQFQNFQQQRQQHQPSQQFFSALFPSAQQPTPGNLKRTGLQRVEKAQAEVAAQLFAFRTAVYAVRLGADTARRLRGGGVIEEDDTSFITGTTRRAAAGDVDDTCTYTTPWEEAFLMRHPVRRIEREKNRGNWQVVLALLDDIERSYVSSHTQHSQNHNNVRCSGNMNLNLGEGDDEDTPHKGKHSHSIIHDNKSNHVISTHATVSGVELYFSPVQIAVERANALMHLGANETAIHILAAALKSQTGSHSRPSSAFALPTFPSAMVTHRENLPGDDVSLRGAMAASLWRCGRWDDDDMLFQHQRTSASVAPISVDEGLFFALKGLHRGDVQEARRWSFLAQRQLARKLNPTNWLHTLLQSEALHNVSTLSDSRVGIQPRWTKTQSSLCNIRANYDKVEILDSVRLRLSVVCQEPDWWLLQLESGGARALRNGRPLLLRQWLTTREEISRAAGKEKMSLLKSTQELPAPALLALLHARAEFAAGNPYGAIAILQNVAPARPNELEEHQLLLSLPPETTSMPVIVHQLIDWVKETGLMPLSQIVRDPFFTACVTSDKSGPCSLQLARLCHALARDIATRLRTPESRGLQESVEFSRHTQEELKRQLDDVGRSEKEKKVLIRRIRMIQLDTAREEQKWNDEVESYALYRRSALNAYARFLKYSDPAGAEDDTLAVFSFVSLWLQQDEQLDERKVRRDTGGGAGGGKNANGDGAPQYPVTKVLRKAIENTPHYKFLPLFSQLAAQLGTSVDDENLEDLVRRIAMENPLQTVWPLLALTKGHEFGPSAAGGAMHVVDERKVAIASRIFQQMKSHTSTDVQGDVWRRKVVTEAERLSAAYMELALHPVRDTTKPSHRIPPSFLLMENIRNMSIPPPTITIPTSVTVPNTCAFPRIVKYEPEFTTPGGINVPKALRCVLSDGRVVRQLLKAEDDLRQDSLIEQVFCLANELLAKEQSTRSLRLYTYNVIPLAPTVGIIEWADGTISLGHYLTGANGKWPIGAHERYFPDEPTTHECRRKMREVGKNLKHNTLLAIYATFTPALHFFFLEHFFTPREWLERRDAYTRSVAVASIVGYIVGLGDRHGSNLLIHTRRAELVHIDLGFAFDQAKLLPVPELVPFRLTRNIVDGLGVQGAEGPLRRHCEGTLRVMRCRRELLLTILEACAHDPLARWAVMVAAPRLDMPQENASGSRQRGAGVQRGKTTYAEAERTISRVAEKIQGYEAGELLTVPTHVQKLLQDAQNTEFLAEMFDGWSPWL